MYDPDRRDREEQNRRHQRPYSFRKRSHFAGFISVRSANKNYQLFNANVASTVNNINIKKQWVFNYMYLKLYVIDFKFLITTIKHTCKCSKEQLASWTQARWRKTTFRTSFQPICHPAIRISRLRVHLCWWG